MVLFGTLGGLRMAVLDSDRFVFSLAGAMLAGAWTAAGIGEAMRRPIADYSPGEGRLPGRLVGAFSEKPTFGELVEWLRGDRALMRLLGRVAVRGRGWWDAYGRRVRGAEGVRPGWLGGVELPVVETEGALANFFGVRLPQLEWMADVGGRNRGHGAGGLWLYRYRWVARRRREPRLLEIPKRGLMGMQRIILEEILNLVPVHGAAHGFCGGRSIVSNARPHCGQRVVLRFDVADFFACVTSGRVFRIFRALGYPAGVARMLMGVCTTAVPEEVWEGRPGGRLGADFEARRRLVGRHLPQGAPTSPALANLAAMRLDRRLAGLAARAGATYTRYADDLTFSGGDGLARGRDGFGAMVAVIAREEGFGLNFRKTRVMRAGVRQEVTGVVVNEKPNVRRAEFDRLKAVLTNCVRHGPAGQNREGVADFRGVLAGRVAHAVFVNAGRGGKLKALFGRIDWA